MKKYIILFLALFAFHNVNSQGWQWLNPLPQGNPLCSVHFFDANKGYMVGSSGTILGTNNGGSTWSIIPSGTTKRLYSICFTDLNNGYISGEGGTILKTINGGETWTTLTSGTTNDLFSICFPNANTGYAVSQNAIIKTTNAGTTWTILPSGTIYPRYSIFFTDTNTGYTGGDYGAGKNSKIFKKSLS